MRIQGPSVPWASGATSPLRSEGQSSLVRIANPSQSVPPRKTVGRLCHLFLQGEMLCGEVTGTLYGRFGVFPFKKFCLKSLMIKRGLSHASDKGQLLPSSVGKGKTVPWHRVPALARSAPVWPARCPPAPAAVPLGPPSHAVSGTPRWARGWAADADGWSVCW